VSAGGNRLDVGENTDRCAQRCVCQSRKRRPSLSHALTIRDCRAICQGVASILAVGVLYALKRCAN